MRVDCRICLNPIAGIAEAFSCSGCGETYHRECWDHVGGCARYGCSNMAEADKPREYPARYWGSNKKTCPYCALEIGVDAMECSHCGSHFHFDRPLSREEVLPRAPDPGITQFRRRAVWLLVGSVLGVTSPLALAVGGCWYWKQRDRIQRSGSTNRAIVQVALGISAIYVALLLFGILTFQLARGR